MVIREKRISNMPCKSGGVLLFKAHQEPESMQGIAKQYPVVVESRDNVFKSTPPHFYMIDTDITGVEASHV